MFSWSMYVVRYLLSNAAHFKWFSDFYRFGCIRRWSWWGFHATNSCQKALTKSVTVILFCWTKISSLFLALSICWTPVLIFTQPQYAEAKFCTGCQLVAQYALFLEQISLITMLKQTLWLINYQFHFYIRNRGQYWWKVWRFNLQSLTTCHYRHSVLNPLYIEVAFSNLIFF